MKQLPFEIIAALMVVGIAVSAAAQERVTRYVRFSHDGQTSYGILQGETIQPLQGDIFNGATPAGAAVKLSDVRLLAPVEPGKVIAIGFNYRSHLGDQPTAAYPGVFLKLPSSIIGPDEPIVYPDTAENLHFEGELVVVIGKEAKDVPVERAGDYIFGITAGNDVSERNWQRDDLQWFRAKASDTFGPLGPAIVTGLNYNDLLVQTRLNGEVMQSQRTVDLIFPIDRIVSYVSQFVTLKPGDVIYTGTPGTTRPMKPGDTVEIEVEGVGVLRNPIVREGGA